MLLKIEKFRAKDGSVQKFGCIWAEKCHFSRHFRACGKSEATKWPAFHNQRKRICAKRDGSV